MDAFSLVDYVHSNELENASLCAARLGDNELVYHFARKAIISGSTPKFLKKKEYWRFRRSEEFVLIEDSLEELVHSCEIGLNLFYRSMIDSLYYLDQRVVRGNISVKGNYDIDVSQFTDSLFALDSLIFNHLLILIQDFGFPSEKVVGVRGYEKAWVILHHNLRMPENSEYLELAKKAVFSGEYRPEHFAWTFEKSLILRGELPFFYFGVSNVSHLTTEERKMVNARRSGFGIKPIESTKIKKTGKRIKQVKLW